MLKKIDKGNGTDYMETIEKQAKLTEKHEMIIKQQTTVAHKFCPKFMLFVLSFFDFFHVSVSFFADTHNAHQNHADTRSK